MRFFKEHKIITVIVSVLLILAVLFAFTAGGDRDGNGVTGTINKVDNFFRTAFSVRSLKGQVDILQEENAQLKKEILEKELTKEQLIELRELANILNYDYLEADYEVISCDVSSYDGSNWTNVFTIDRGTEAGIKVGDCVCNGLGLVGKIQETGEGWSKVVSVIDEDFSVSFKLARKGGQLGICHGDKNGNVTGYMMDAESNVAEGDLILTSGLGIFPEGIEIGNVKAVSYNDATLLKEIEIATTVNFKELQKVAIVKFNNSKEE